MDEETEKTLKFVEKHLRLMETHLKNINENFKILYGIIGAFLLINLLLICNIYLY